MFKVAVIGAPNVGKSTFFNKMIGGRRSIVEDIPGVTRDRVYAEVNLGRFTGNDHTSIPITLIDTGGLFFENDTLYEGVQNQVFQAVNEANCVIFMLNGRTGITSTDTRIVEILRRSNKKIILLVNKIDSPDLITYSSEFYSLGLGEVVPFSNLGSTFGAGMRQLIDLLLEYGAKSTNSREHTDNTDMPKVVLLGKPNTGKSSILNKLVGYERSLVHDQAGTTRDALDTFLKYQDKDIMMIDTAGLRRKSKVYDALERYSVDRSIKGLVRADMAVLVIDVHEGISHQEKKLASLIEKRKKGCIIVLNKWDLIEDKDFNAYQENIKRELGFVNYAPVVITSAVTGQRVSNILDEVLRVYTNINRKIKTSILNNVLREITMLRWSNSKIKIYYATQTGNNPFTLRLFVNEPKHIEDQHLLFLSRALREEFELDGVPINWEIVKST